MIHWSIKSRQLKLFITIQTECLIRKRTGLIFPNQIGMLSFNTTENYFQNNLLMMLNHQSMSNLNGQNFLFRSNGESDAVLTPSYAILSNACLTASHMNIQLFGEKGQSIPNRVKKLFKINDFYCIFLEYNDYTSQFGYNC